MSHTAHFIFLEIAKINNNLLQNITKEIPTTITLSKNSLQKCTAIALEINRVEYETPVTRSPLYLRVTTMFATELSQDKINIKYCESTSFTS